MSSDDLKLKTARTVKWNLIDRLVTQVMYAVTGIVLANILSQDDFGLVGAVLVFQAFATLLVDSGFASALMQRKAPTRLDYSSVLWFNIATAVVLYAVLWFCAPAIADFYGGDRRIIALSRVMFLSLIANSTLIVQSNILMKKMDVGKIALTNVIGLAVSSAVGILLAVKGFGPWAIVWQTITLAVVKSVSLWVVARWTPLARMSLTALRSFVPVASRMMLSSFLNVLFRNVYSMLVGNRAGMRQLGYYTQSDKWSMMGITAISQALNASFLPALAEVQDDRARFASVCSKTNRFTSYILFPATIGLAVMAEPLFHTLFGTKWDPSVILFQLLLVRGIFVVLAGLYNNYLLALGRAKEVLRFEIVRDVAALVALGATLPYMTITLPDNPVAGLEVMLLWQIVASALTWVYGLFLVVRATSIRLTTYLRDMLPYVAMTAVCVPVVLIVNRLDIAPIFILLADTVASLIIYTGLNALLGSKIQSDVFAFVFHRKSSQTSK